jgi:anti-sigma regulatory factor (Ser/Thr protein kinase)
MSLMPGTVSVALEPDAIEIHVIDTGLPVDAALRRIEEAVAGAFVRGDGG